MHKEPSQDDPTFYWHDFGGASSRTHSARPQVIGEFARKIGETISEIQEAAHASIPGLPSIPKFVFDGSDAEYLQMHLRSYTVDVHNHVIGWSGDEKLRRQALLSLFTGYFPGLATMSWSLSWRRVTRLRHSQL